MTGDRQSSANRRQDNGISKRRKQLGHQDRAAETANLSSTEQQNLILDIFYDFVEQGSDDLFSYFDHVGFDPRVVREPSELPSAWLGHYRIRRGEYDVDRACTDFATWPPIASRIFELMREARG